MNGDTPRNIALAVAQRIRAVRQDAGLTQAQLAERLDVTQTCVSYWELGRRVLNLEDLIRVAAALGKTTSDLLPTLPSSSNGTASAIAVANSELRTVRDAMRELNHMVDALERGDSEKFVLTQRNRMRAVIVSVERFAELQAASIPPTESEGP